MYSLPSHNRNNTDTFGIPLKVGDTVLTNGYGSPIMNFVTKVVKQTKSYSFVEVKTSRWDRSTNSVVTVVKPLRKYSYQLIRIQPLLDYNAETYPEVLL